MVVLLNILIPSHISFITVKLVNIVVVHIAVLVLVSCHIADKFIIHSFWACCH